MKRYLTKSRFKMALECETKLFYTAKKNEYADQSLDDSFMEALAEGGFQVGELAKFYVCNDPVSSNITVEPLDYELSLSETQERIVSGDRVIAEAAFRFENLFIRTDIFKIDTKQKTINFFEVKAKSVDSTTDFWTNSKKAKELRGSWLPYLYDIAFQKYVLVKLYPDYKINAYLTFTDKNAIATVDGLNQFFKIDKSGKKTKIIVKDGLKRKDLGAKVLTDKLVNDEIQWIWDNPVKTKINGNISFADYIDLLSTSYYHNRKINTTIGSKCKKCQFRTTPEEDKSGKFKSGFMECWKNATGLDDTELKKPLIISLWSGGFTKMQELIDSGTFLIEDVNENLISPKTKNKKAYPGLSPLQRRLIQIEKVQNNDWDVFLDKKGLSKAMSDWVYPLHFIDFETTRVAIPFHNGRRPYEQVAFQFSHHLVAEDGSIKHAGQFISFEPGAFPNFEFLRALKKELENDQGSIFRYHNHENNVLNDIYNQLNDDKSGIKDKNELMEFIRSITHRNNEKERWEGGRDMIDLYRLVTDYYYPPAAGGSNSLKYILPATIESSDFLQNKYSQPVYGTSTMPSLNFKEMVWLPNRKEFNPYHVLPPVFENLDSDKLDSMFEGFDEVSEGGAAMTAYAKLQFSFIPNEQREMIRRALLKYCELDTLAMVMIWEYWMKELES